MGSLVGYFNAEPLTVTLEATIAWITTLNLLDLKISRIL